MVHIIGQSKIAMCMYTDRSRPGETLSFIDPLPAKKVNYNICSNFNFLILPLTFLYYSCTLEGPYQSIRISPLIVLDKIDTPYKETAKKSFPLVFSSTGQPARDFLSSPNLYG